MKKYKIIGLFAVIVFALFSCQEQSELVEGLDFEREFSPLGIEVKASNHNSATIAWKAMKGSTEHYVIQLFQDDSLAFNGTPMAEKSVQYEYENRFENLLPEVQYSVRLKTRGETPDQDSHWHGIAFKTSSEQILTGIKNVKATLVTVNWTAGETVTHLLFTATEEADIRIDLTADDIAAGAKTLEKNTLKSDKSYQVSIYNGIGRRGKLTFKTLYKPEGAVEVPIGGDLSAITGDAANIGKVIYLPEGFTYDISASAGILVAGTMTIYGDPDAEIKPAITLSSTSGGARVFQLPASADEILFANLKIAGPGAGGGTSVLDQDLAKAAEALTGLKAIKFENCDIADFGRSLIRLRSAAGSNPIELVSLNNCYCKGFGNNTGDGGSYAFFTLNTVSSGIENIVVTNSTFQTQYHSFVNAPATSPNTSPAKNVTIENCTFNDIITGPTGTSARYLVDGNNNTGLTVIIKNIILGKAGTGDAATTKAGQYRMGTGSTISVTGSYRTSDHSTAPATADFTSGVTSYLGASTDLWTDPVGGDFSFKDTSFAGKTTAGDPKWR
jgi:hypothetical protein